MSVLGLRSWTEHGAPEMSHPQGSRRLFEKESGDAV